MLPWYSKQRSLGKRADGIWWILVHEKGYEMWKWVVVYGEFNEYFYRHLVTRLSCMRRKKLWPFLLSVLMFFVLFSKFKVLPSLCCVCVSLVMRRLMGSGWALFNSNFFDYFLFYFPLFSFFLTTYSLLWLWYSSTRATRKEASKQARFRRMIFFVPGYL